MLHLSFEGIVHRDLAARNILLSSTLIAKISDFGMSRKVENTSEENQTIQNIGPVRWMVNYLIFFLANLKVFQFLEAPESMTSGIYSEKSDVWSFGITMIEILTRRAPYEGKPTIEVGISIANRQLDPRDQIPKWCNTEINQILSKCFSYDAQWFQTNSKELNNIRMRS